MDWNRISSLSGGLVFFDEARGGWVGQASVGVNPSTGKRRWVKVRAATTREAHRRLYERIAELERTSGAVTPNTVGELVAKWLTREAPKTMSPRTLTMVRTMVTNHALPTLVQMRVSELRAEHIEQLLMRKPVRASREVLLSSFTAIWVRPMTPE